MDEPTITLPIHEFLEYLWTYKDKAIIDSVGIVADTLFKFPNEAIFHLEQNGKLLIVWRAKDWALSQEKFSKEKERSEKRVASWNLRNEIKDELKKLIIKKMGNLGLEDSLSENIIKTKNTAMVLALNGSQELCQKMQTL